MRLRLSIRRHGLSDTQILWNTNGINSTRRSASQTPNVAQFLQDVNDVIPLESEDWGLEDYVVEVGGFECVHFSALDSIFQQDDNVIIRPLETNDRRHRRANGREQISSDGRRLYDGVAFGRPFIRRRARPPVRIPSATGPQNTYVCEETSSQEMTNQLVVRENSQEEEEEEDDSDYYDEQMSSQELADLANDNHMYEEELGRAHWQSTTRLGKRQRSTGLGINAAQTSPPSRPSTASSTLRQRRGQSLGQRLNAQRSASVRFEEDQLETPATVLAIPEDTNEDEEDDGDYTSDDDTSVDTEADKENIAPFTLSSFVAKPQKAQKYRPKSSNSLDETSSDESDGSTSSDNISDENPETASESTSSASSSDSSSDSSDDDSEPVPNTTKVELRRVQIASQNRAAGKAMNNPPGQGSVATRRRNQRRKLKKHHDKVAKAAEKDPVNEAAATARAIEAEADLEAAKLAILGNLITSTSNSNHRSESGSSAPEELPSKDTHMPSPDEVETDDAWEDKIDLQAVECCYDGVEYSAPPFPFIQRWDPQQRYNTKRKGKGGGGRRKRQKRNNSSYYQEDYENYVDNYQNDNTYEQHEDQDTGIQVGNMEQYADESMNVDEDAQAANEQLQEELAGESGPQEDDLPKLPEDLSSLEPLTTNTAQVGTIIAFKQLEMSERTGWAPVISNYRTARIEVVLETNVLGVLLAARDVPDEGHKYDSETGERVYSKFDMPRDDESESDPRFLLIGLQDMIEPKLMQNEQTIAPSNDKSEQSAATTVSTTIVVEENLDHLGSGTTMTVDAAEVTVDGVIEHAVEDEEEASAESRENSMLLTTGQSTVIATAETSMISAREPSIELGSQHPPTRHFSELKGSKPEAAADDLDDGYVPFAVDDETERDLPEDENEESEIEDTQEKIAQVPEREPDVTAMDTAVDAPADPSIWMPNSTVTPNISKFYALNLKAAAPTFTESAIIDEFEVEEPTRYFSPKSAMHEQSTKKVSTKSSPAASPSESESEGFEPVSTSIIPEKISEMVIESATAAMPLKETLQVAEDPPLDEPPLAVDEDEEEATFTQESVKPAVRHTAKRKIVITKPIDYDSDPDSDSDGSSLISFKGLTSQRIGSIVNPARADVQNGKTNGYPEIVATIPDTTDLFVFSQAPQRVVSVDTHKIAVQNDSSFHGSSPTGAFELPGDSPAPFDDVKSEDEAPELPPPTTQSSQSSKKPSKSNLFRSPLFKRTASTQEQPADKPTPEVKAKSTKDATIVDLTFSSDPEEPDDDIALRTRRSSSRRIASQMPSGPGRSTENATPSPSRNNKGGLKRTKSLV